MHTGTPRPYRPPAEDRPIRRTWWLLSCAFLILGLITGFRALTSGDRLDWIPVAAVALAAVAAFLHRNAVASLEARGRAEAENFARILQGLSRSVSVDAIVGAIVDDLAEGTGADHVVVVRRRPEGEALEATLVTSRPGVPSSTTMLPLTDLESYDREPPPAIPVPIVAAGDMPERELVATATAAGARLAVVDGSGGAGSGGARPAAGAATVNPIGPPAGPHAHRGRSTTARRAVERGSAWLAGLRDELGVLHPFGSSGPLMSPRSEVIGATWASSGGSGAGRAQARRAAAGRAAAITARIADRVRSLYGLTHTLAAPLHTEAGVIGAIVLSRRDREPWPDAARRLLEAAAVEAAAAMARAYSYREVAAHASTDPLTGLPNRRYFDEFCGLLARRRRAGDEVAVLMVDIDKFKGLNDRYGHAVGDEVLRAVAGAIVTAVREEDVPARVGGEEFAVLLRNPGPDVAVEVGERVRQAVRALDLRRHGVSGVSVSVGVANARGADEPIPEIVERADQALLRAKRAGRDRVIAA
ncbi:MAG TPA: GGDEF domain-containing protein [Candidatus Limnocylindrales bacterium]|nr:GGDEF domain-containing protein [Candidatus Limnocylindrales bacterium]